MCGECDGWPRQVGVGVSCVVDTTTTTVTQVMSVLCGVVATWSLEFSAGVPRFDGFHLPLGGVRHHG